LNFSKDLYGKKISIELKQNIRNEIKFDSINTLKDQIKVDIKKVKELFQASLEL
jgi:riboflavin kinase/FMN adenylyltransferase